MRVLLTRPEADAKKTAGRLKTLGHDAVICPLFEIISTQTPAPATPFDALIATSAHAFQAHAGEVAHLRDLPLYLVGERSALAAREKGFTQIVHVAPDAKTLAIAIAQEKSRARTFLYLAGRERRPELEASLAALGHAVAPWIVYETSETEDISALVQEWRTGMLDAVMHFSPRSAALYQAHALRAGMLAQALQPLQIVISPRAAEALGDAPNVRVAASPDLESLIDCLPDRA
jgi:uroporphyrinogen-III synthase